MKFAPVGYPLIVLSHRKHEFLHQCVGSLRDNITGIGEVLVVDDSGDPEHREWLADHGYNMSAVDVSGNAGYLESMRHIWEIVKGMDSPYVMLWEEDFLLTQRINVEWLARIMNDTTALAQLNLQRQPVYAIEKRLGYMESHRRRGYGLTAMQGNDVTGARPWVARRRPFTTNPGLLRTSVVKGAPGVFPGIEWPEREVCDLIPGGAEPAMSRDMERAGWFFGWYGIWNTPATHHLGDRHKSGTGY